MFKKASYLLIPVFFLLAGCTLEQKLAKTFLATKPIGEFVLLEPDFLYKTNLKTFNLDGYDQMDEVLRDSLLYEKSLFLKDISDSLLINEFVSAFKKTFESYGALMYMESSLDTLMENGGHPFILNMAQFTLEEFIHPYSHEELVYDEVLIIDGFDVNAINYNIWIELSRMNTEKKNKVLFSSDFLTDDVKGVMRQNIFTGKFIFDYTIDTITTKMTYEFARYFGEKTAAEVFDYLLNAYVDENLPVDYPYEPYYYHWDPQRKILIGVEEEDRIIVLDNK